MTSSGVYSNTEIFRAIKEGHIICAPFIPENVNTSSLDVTLGENYFKTDGESLVSLYNPYDPNNVADYFGEVQVALPFREHRIARHLGSDALMNIPYDHPIIILGPGERILAHTHEFVGINPPGTSSMQGRSTTGRNGISVCVDAGWGDSGYINRWTMEVANLNKRHHVVLPIGERIAQMVFYHTGEVSGEYSSDANSGKYQAKSGKDLNELIRSWVPEVMLPRAYKDQRTLPKPL